MKQFVEAVRQAKTAFAESIAQPTLFRIEDVNGDSHFAKGEDQLLTLICDIPDGEFKVFEETPCNDYVGKLVEKRSKSSRRWFDDTVVANAMPFRRSPVTDSD